ncbi:MAG: hypothetical protein ABR592_05515 [Nitriliruptorales bacterium]
MPTGDATGGFFAGIQLAYGWYGVAHHPESAREQGQTEGPERAAVFLIARE